MITGKRWLDMRDTINQDMTHTREIAKAIAYSKQFDVYALNHNWSTYDRFLDGVRKPINEPFENDCGE